MGIQTYHRIRSKNNYQKALKMKVLSILPILTLLPNVIYGDLAADLQANGLTTLLKFVVDAGLADTLGSVEPATIFAPTNAAFAALPSDVVAALTSDPELLKNTLLYHVIPNAAIPSSALKADNKVDTATGAPLRVNVYQKHGRTTVTANGVRVIKPDVEAGSGSIVHVVEKVLPTVEKGDNIAAVLTKDGRFGTLLAAVTAADLAGAVSTTDGLTVFAPTDDAFAKIPASTLEFLLKPENKGALTAILTRHVVPKPVFAAGIGCKSLQTLNPDSNIYTYKRGYGNVFVKTYADRKYNKAQVVDADIVATNGVVHAIDSVV